MKRVVAWMALGMGLGLAACRGAADPDVEAAAAAVPQALAKAEAAGVPTRPDMLPGVGHSLGDGSAAYEQLQAKFLAIDGKHFERIRRESRGAPLGAGEPFLAPFKPLFAQWSKIGAHDALWPDMSLENLLRLDLSSRRVAYELTQLAAFNAEAEARRGNPQGALRWMGQAAHLAHAIGAVDAYAPTATYQGLAFRAVRESASKLSHHWKGAPDHLAALRDTLGGVRPRTWRDVCAFEMYGGIAIARNAEALGVQRILAAAEPSEAPVPDEAMLLKDGVPSGKLERAYLTRALETAVAIKRALSLNRSAAETGKVIDAHLATFAAEKGGSYALYRLSLTSMEKSLDTASKAEAAWNAMLQELEKPTAGRNGTQPKRT